MLVAALVISLAQEIQVRHPDPPFTLRLPAGFELIKEPWPGTAYRWKRALGPGSNGFVLLNIEINDRMIGRVGIEDLKADVVNMLPAGTPHQFHTLKWKGFDIYALEAVQKKPEGEFATFVVTIPLMPRAIVLGTAGPSEDRLAIESDFRAVVATLTGQSNWLTPARRFQALATGGMAVLGWCAWLLYGIVWLFAFRQRFGRAVGLRAIWLGTAAVLLMGAVATSLTFDGFLKGNFAMGQVISTLGAFAAAHRATNLWNARVQPTQLPNL